jgi:hypothetical protein
MALIDPSTASAAQLSEHLGFSIGSDEQLVSALRDLLPHDDDDELVVYGSYVSRTRTVTIRRRLGELVWTEQRTVRTVHPA